MVGPALPVVAEVLKYIVGVAVVTFVSVLVGTRVLPKETVMTKEKAKTKKTDFEGQTVIYRKETCTNHNLTPRPKDKNGLSFQTEEPLGEKYSVTTVELVNSTMILTAFNDKPGHYAIKPTIGIEREEIAKWQFTRETANEKPYFYTIALKSVLWDSNGNYCGIGE